MFILLNGFFRNLSSFLAFANSFGSRHIQEVGGISQTLNKTSYKYDSNDRLIDVMSQIQSIASISHNVLSSQDKSLYIDDVAKSLIIIRNLAADVKENEGNIYQ